MTSSFYPSATSSSSNESPTQPATALDTLKKRLQEQTARAARAEAALRKSELTQAAADKRIEKLISELHSVEKSRDDLLRVHKQPYRQAQKVLNDQLLVLEAEHAGRAQALTDQSKRNQQRLQQLQAEKQDLASQLAISKRQFEQLQLAHSLESTRVSRLMEKVSELEDSFETTTGGMTSFTSPSTSRSSPSDLASGVEEAAIAFLNDSSCQIDSVDNADLADDEKLKFAVHSLRACLHQLLTRLRQRKNVAARPSRARLQLCSLVLLAEAILPTGPLVQPCDLNVTRHSDVSSPTRVEGEDAVMSVPPVLRGWAARQLTRCANYIISCLSDLDTCPEGSHIDLVVSVSDHASSALLKVLAAFKEFGASANIHKVENVLPHLRDSVQSETRQSMQSQNDNTLSKIDKGVMTENVEIENVGVNTDQMEEQVEEDAASSGSMDKVLEFMQSKCFDQERAAWTLSSECWEKERAYLLKKLEGSDDLRKSCEQNLRREIQRLQDENDALKSAPKRSEELYQEVQMYLSDQQARLEAVSREKVELEGRLLQLLTKKSFEDQSHAPEMRSAFEQSSHKWQRTYPSTEHAAQEEQVPIDQIDLSLPLIEETEEELKAVQSSPEELVASPVAIVLSPMNQEVLSPASNDLSPWSFLSQRVELNSTPTAPPPSPSPNGNANVPSWPQPTLPTNPLTASPSSSLSGKVVSDGSGSASSDLETVHDISFGSI